MKETAITARIFGSFFSRPVSDTANQLLLSALAGDDVEQSSPFSMLPAAAAETETNDLNWQFQTLFEGCGEMIAPPWGSVYLDKEQVLFGDSTLRYRDFLSSHGMELDTGTREPEDQFGLMLFATANLIENGQEDAAKTLFAEHLLPWAAAYLSKLQQNEVSGFYSALAELAGAWLEAVQDEMALTPKVMPLYR